MFEVYTVYKSFPELHLVVDTGWEAEELVEELKQRRDLDDAYFEKGE